MSVSSTESKIMYLLCRRIFLFLPFLNLGAQIRCPQNRYTDLKLALDQPLTALASIYAREMEVCS